MGTQTLRWQLTESLQLAVIDIEERPGGEQAAQAIKDGVHDGWWSNAARAMRFRLPGDEWTVESDSQGATTTLRIRPPRTDDPGSAMMIHFMVFDLSPTIPVRMVVQGRLSAHRSTLPDLELLQDEEIMVHRAKGVRISLRGTPEGAPPVAVTELVWSENGTGCLLNIIATEPLHAQWLHALESIAESFEFVGR